jgi:hypothetical protein
MILNGNQRGGARDLAIHLMKPENEHVEVHEIRGFVADTLAGALREAEAVSRGSRCCQFLYSLSLSPPETEHVPVAVFESAVDRIEERLGLTGHSRVIVFHEKNGRRHAHCVWSRIDTATMTAVRMSHDRRKLTEISRELYLEHRWKMPDGLIDPELRSPLNFDRQEWFKAKRVGKDPRDIKAAFRQCWAASDSSKSFRQALEQRGYYLAKGDRRGVVAVSVDGEVYALSRWCGLKEKEVNSRFADTESLPSVDDLQKHVAGLVREKLSGFIRTATAEFSRVAESLEGRRLAMMQEHRSARRDLQAMQEAHRTAEAKARAARFRRGVLGLWDRLTGTHAKLRAENEDEVAACALRDADETQALIERQLRERRALQNEIVDKRRLHSLELAKMHRALGEQRPPVGAADSEERRADAPSQRRKRTRTLSL